MSVKRLKIFGYSIIELSVVMVIAATLLTGFFAFTVNKSIDLNQKQNDEKMQQLSAAIQKFYFVNGYLPCPSSLDNSSFGTSYTCIGSEAGTFDYVPGGNNTIKFGGVPVRTLNLPDSAMFDAWGNRIRYVIPKNLGNRTTFASSPTNTVINITDSSGNNVVRNLTASNYVMYLLISHGPNGIGAYDYNGAQPIGCSGGLEANNCDTADAAFRSTFYTTGSFDDTLVWATRQYMKYRNDIENRVQYQNTTPQPSTETKIAYFAFETYGGNVGSGAANVWDRRILNLDSAKGITYANDVLVVNNITGLTHTANSQTISVPAGTYYMRATQSGCSVNGHMVRIVNATASTTIGISNAAYASSETRDCSFSEAVTLVTFAAATNVAVEAVVQDTSGMGFCGAGCGYSYGTPALLNVSFPWSYVPYATVILEVQKWAD